MKQPQSEVLSAECIRVYKDYYWKLKLHKRFKDITVTS
jgi:hypothetical protein